MITTKSGKEGKITVNANASVQFEDVFRFCKVLALKSGHSLKTIMQAAAAAAEAQLEQ